MGLLKKLAPLVAAGALALGVVPAVHAQERQFYSCNSINPVYGVKNVFSIGEPLVLVDIDPFCKVGDLETVYVYGPAGNALSSSSMNMNSYGEEWNVFSNTQNLAQMGGYGNYRAVFSDNNQVIGEVDFAIAPPPQYVAPPIIIPERPFWPFRPFYPRRRF